MAPKKGKTQTMSLGDFLQDQSLGPSSSWADEVEEYSIGTQPLPPTDRSRNTGSAWGGGGDRGDRGGYATRERDIFPTRIPDRPPYTAHLGNLSYDATVESVTDFFTGCSIISVRIIEDREQQRPKGFAYAEFENVDGLKKALDLDGTPLEGRPMRIKIADPPRGGDRDGRGDSTRDLSSWERKGPLPELPSRNRGGDFGDRRGPSDFGDRRGPSDFGERRGPSDFGERRGPTDFGDRSERRQSRDAMDDGKVRDFNNWERRGPLSPAAPPPAMERQMSREGSRSRNEFGPRSESFRNNRKASPATWGEGRPQTEEGSRPPRREFADKPERVPTAAEKDTQWRDRMRPDAQAKSPAQSRDGTETPSSPVPGAQSPAVAPAPASRPRLNLQKRTVSETADASTPTTSDSKASPFGAARPIDTAAREREVEVRRLQAIQEKREADEKAKEERQVAKEKEAAAKAEAEAAAAAAAAAPPEEPSAAPVADADAPQPAADQAPVNTEPKGSEAAEGDKPVEGDASAAPTSGQKLPSRPKDGPRDGSKEDSKEGSPKFSRATESGNWRSSGDRARGGAREPRGRGGPRGNRNFEGGRGGRQNGSFSGRDQRDQQRGERDQQRGERDQQRGERDQQRGERDQQRGERDQQRGERDQQRGERDQQREQRDQPPSTPTATTRPTEDGWTTVTKDKRRSQGKLMV